MLKKTYNRIGMKYWAPIFALLAFLIASASAAEDIHGTLLDSAGKPVAGAALGGVARPPDAGRQAYQSYRATTDVQGKFTFTHMPVKASSATPVLFLARLTDGRIFDGRLTEDNGTVKLSATSIRVRIKAVDGQDQPIAGATAEVSSISTKTPADATYLSSLGFRPGEFKRVTGPDGIATFEGMPPGAYIGMKVTSTGLSTVESYIETPSSGEVSQDAVLRRSATVSGHVLKDGKPVGGVSVVALSLVNHMGRELRARTDADGSYRLDNLPPGTVSISVISNEATGGLVAPPIADVPIAEGAQIANADLVLQPGIPLRLRVTAERSGKPIEGAVVRISVGMVDSEMKKTDADGRIELMVPPGHHYIAVDSVGARRMDGRPYLHLDITAEKNPLWELRIPDAALFPPIAHLKGIVVDKAGKVVSGATVRALFAGSQVASDAKGAFSFPGAIQPGDLIVAVKGDAMSARAIEAADKPSIKVLLSGKGAEIRGRVVGFDGHPLPGVEVTLGGQRGNDYINLPPTTTDAKGMYRFANIYASIDNFFIWAKRTGMGSATIQPIKLDPGEKRMLADMTITPADGVIEGIVVGPDGSPVKGVEVSAQVEESENAVTDETGRFKLTKVPRGRHNVRASKPGFLIAVVEVSTGQKGIVVKIQPGNR